MAQDTKYNGWTNYATWRVNLEMFDGNAKFLIDNSDGDAGNLSQELRDYALESVNPFSNDGFVYDIATAFLNDVNWYEIAEHMIDEYRQEEAA